MHLSRRWRRLLAGLGVLGVLAFLEWRSDKLASCPPGGCPLPQASASR
jgi:hypothetical protein